MDDDAMLFHHIDSLDVQDTFAFLLHIVKGVIVIEHTRLQPVLLEFLLDLHSIYELRQVT